MTLFTGSITLLGLLAFCWSVGNAFPRNHEARDFGVWTGLLAVLALSSLVHFFTPIGSLGARAIICMFGLVGLLRSLWSAYTVAKLRAALTSKAACGLAGVVVATTALSLRAVTNADSGLYHFQAVEFLRSERFIIGWANLHIRLAHPSSAYQIAALAENGLWGSDGYRLTAALIMVLTVLTFAGALTRLRGESGGPSDAFLVVALPCVWGMLLFNTAYFSGVALDGTTALVGVVAAGRVLRFMEQRSAPSLVDAAVVVAIAYSLRPINAWFVLVLLVALFVFRGDPEISLRHVALPVAFIGLFIARTWLLSGVPVFPVGRGTPWTPWAISSDEVAQYRDVVATSARGSLEPLWADFSLFAGWVDGLSIYLGGFSLAGLLSTALVVRLRTTRRPWGMALILGLVTVFVAVLMWFFFGPNFRFGMAPLASLAALPVLFLQIGEGRNASSHEVRSLTRWTSLVLVLLLVVVPALGSHRTSLLRPMTSPSVRPTGERPPVVEVSRYGDISISAPLGDASFCGREVWCVPDPSLAERLEVRRLLLWHLVTRRDG